MRLRLGLEFGHFSPRSGRECVAQGKSAQPWVSMWLLTVSPRSGRQKKLQIRDVREAAAARCTGLGANAPTSPGLRRLALGSFHTRYAGSTNSVWWVPRRLRLGRRGLNPNSPVHRACRSALTSPLNGLEGNCPKGPNQSPLNRASG